MDGPVTNPASRRLPIWPAGCVAALVLAGDFEFRRRPTGAALSSSVDLAIIIELLVYLSIAGYLFLTVARPPKGTLARSPLAAAWALCLALALSGVWAPSRNLGLARGVQLLCTIGLISAITRRAEARTWHVIVHAYIALITLGVAIGLVYARPPDQQLSGRFLWLYGHPVVSGSLLALSVVCLVAWIKDPQLTRWFPRKSYPFLLVAHGIALLLTETRGSVVAAAIGVVTVIWVAAPGRGRRDLVVLGAVAVPVLVVASWSALTAFATRGEGTENLKQLNSRTRLWSEAFRVLREHPFTGRGYFSSREIFLESIGLGGAHNAYIEVAVSAGLVGVAFLTILLVRIGHGLLRSGRHPDRPVLAGLFVTMLINAITAQYLAQSGTGANVMFFVLVGWVAWINGPGRLPRASSRRPAAATLTV